MAMAYCAYVFLILVNPILPADVVSYNFVTIGALQDDLTAKSSDCVEALRGIVLQTMGTPYLWNH